MCSQRSYLFIVSIMIYVFVLISIYKDVYALEAIESASAEASQDDDGLLSAIGDYILGIVIPDDEFLEKQFDKLDAKLKSKLPFQSYINTVGRFKEISSEFDGDASALDITYEYGGSEYTIEIGSVISPHVPKIRGIITGLYVFYIAIYNYNQLMFLIRGSKYTETVGNVMVRENMK